MSSGGPGRWTQQQATDGPMSVLNDIRAAIHEGRFDTRDWDHNSPQYQSPRSNKRVKIAARSLLGRDPLDSKEMWAVVIDAAIGAKPHV